MPEYQQLTIYTVGHSTRSKEEFLDILHHARIEQLVDIRSIPKSRRYPHFAIEIFPLWLQDEGIDYIHLPKLGGRRPKSKEPTPNQAWKNQSFRNYADYALTEPFREGLSSLEELADKRVTAICCSEAVYWRCHRSIVADFLTARGCRVLHIMSASSIRPHSLRDFAQIVGEQVIYPSEGELS